MAFRRDSAIMKVAGTMDNAGIAAVVSVSLGHRCCATMETSNPSTQAPANHLQAEKARRAESAPRLRYVLGTYQDRQYPRRQERNRQVMSRLLLVDDGAERRQELRLGARRVGFERDDMDVAASEQEAYARISSE